MLFFRPAVFAAVAPLLLVLAGNGHAAAVDGCGSQAAVPADKRLSNTAHWTTAICHHGGNSDGGRVESDPRSARAISQVISAWAPKTFRANAALPSVASSELATPPATSSTGTPSAVPAPR